MINSLGVRGIIIFVFSLLLSSCGSIDNNNVINNPNNEIDNAEFSSFKQPLFTTQITLTLTQLASSQRISPLTASRIQAYTYLAAYIAYNSSEEGNKSNSAVAASSEIGKFLYFNVPIVESAFDMLKLRYSSDVDLEAVDRAVSKVKELISSDKYEDVLYNYQRPLRNDKYSWKPTGINQRSFQDPNFGDLKTISDVRDLCKLEAPDYKLAEREALELFDNFDITKTNNEYVTTFLAGIATPTPPGQNLSIITSATIDNGLSIEDGLKAITASAVAMFDVAILSWFEKREHMLARPESLYYNLTGKRISLTRETPAHPSYPSGHSSFTGANVEVIERMIGKDISLKLSLPEDMLAAEKSYIFNNPRDLISKVNQSRVDAGFHYPLDVKAGESLGRCVGGFISNNFDDILADLL